MRACVALATLLLVVGCASSDLSARREPKPTRVISPEKYRTPFGEPPAQADLAEIFLSLPDPLAADMTLKMRKGFLEMQRDNFLVDYKNRYITFFSDNPYFRLRPSSRFILKVFPSSKFGYVVFLHLIKPTILGTPPAPGNTFILVPVEGHWRDITNEVLPRSVRRDAYFQPLRLQDIVEVGTYEKRKGVWRWGEKLWELRWKNDRFTVQSPRTKEFAFD